MKSDMTDGETKVGPRERPLYVPLLHTMGIPSTGSPVLILVVVSLNHNHEFAPATKFLHLLGCK